MSSKTTISHEPVDDIPVIVEWLLDMHVDKLIDKILPQPHGNWKGLTYGQVIVIWLVFILSQADHRMCVVEEWVGNRVTVLRRCTDWEVTAGDLTDDRLEIVLDVIGEEQTRHWETLDEELGKQVIQAYRLPTKVGLIRQRFRCITVMRTPVERNISCSSLARVKTVGQTCVNSCRRWVHWIRRVFHWCRQRCEAARMIRRSICRCGVVW